MLNNIYYIPGYYWLRFNIWGLSNFFGYIFTVHFPVIMIHFMYSGFSFKFFFWYIINFLIFIIFYEVFYIQNDFRASREKDSTIRFDFWDTIIPWWKIILIRTIYIGGLYLFLFILDISFLFHLLILALIGVVFFIHNILRAHFRFITFFLLFVLKIGILFTLPILPANPLIVWIFLVLFGLFWSVPYFYKKNIHSTFPIDIIVFYLVLFLIFGLIVYCDTTNLVLLNIAVILLAIKLMKTTYETHNRNSQL